MVLVKIGIKSSHGRLQLVFTYQGKRHYLSPGYPDTALGRQYAQLLAAKIQEDILKDKFTGVDVYRREKAQAPPPEAEASITLPDLWRQYLDYLRPMRSPSTMGRQFRWQTKVLENCPYGLEDAPKIRDWILQERSPDSARRFLVSLNACCKWGVASGLIPDNPLEKVKVKISKSAHKEINPFSASERDRILQVLANSRKFGYYYRIVGFLFFTGCRLSEAVALEWSHIAKDGKSLTFVQAAVQDELGRLRIKPGLKRQQKRKIPLSDKVREFLGEREDGLVFPAVRGGLMDLGNFSSRGWKNSLIEAEVDYRNLYQCRHTFITLALKGTDSRKPLSVQDVAKIVGNSPGIIYRCYAGVTQDLELPD